jgi:hypothetical protein
MENEIWKDVKGFAGRYQVSNMGRVRYPDTWVTRSYPNGTVAYFISRRGAIKEPILNKHGYSMKMTKENCQHGRTISVCELVASHFSDQYIKGMEIIHKDGDIFNNHIDNLAFRWPGDLDGELWKPIKGFEGLYEVSNMGRFRSIEKTKTTTVKNGSTAIMRVRPRLLKMHKVKNGYCHVHLSKDSKKYEYSAHRLVALHFCDGYADGLVVNHKNEIKSDNRSSNLEWCTEEYNRNYGTRTERCAKSNQKRVAQYTSDGVLIAEYESGKEASEKTGYHRACISDWCRGAHPCKSGFIWKFI